MSQEELNSVDAVEPTKKKKMTVDKFFQQFNTLDMNNYGSWPLSVKITCWIFLFFVVCGLGYFLALQPKLEAIDSARLQETNLLNEYRQKDSKHRNLKQYETQLAQMETRFTEQLLQLPKDTEIPSLVEDINITGVESGLKFKNIRLEPDVKQEFFTEQPIAIEATGDYHAFGNFVSNLAKRERIVTLHDFIITASENQNKKSDIPVVDYSLKAKTYYLGQENEKSMNVGVAQPPANTAVAHQASDAVPPTQNGQGN